MTQLVAAYSPDGADVDARVRAMSSAVRVEGSALRTWSTVGAGIAIAGDDLVNGALATDEETGVVVALAGRLVARRELATGLGLRTTEGGDGALALHAYLAWGERFAGRLLGEFALALWDPRSSSLVVARDPSGVRMLVHAVDAGGTHVVSTLPSQILRGAAVPARVDPVGFADLLLTRGSLLPDRTVCAPIRRVPPGSTLVLGRNGARVAEEASFLSIAVAAPLERAPDPERLASAIEEALVDRIDGPRAGVLLSGGWDSGALLELWMDASRRGREIVPPMAFTHYPLGAGDERSAVGERVERFGLEARSVQLPMDGSVLDGLDELAGRIGSPEVTPIWQAHRRIARVARDLAIGSLVAGDGGDISVTSPYAKVARLLARRGPIEAIRQLRIFAAGSVGGPGRQVRSTIDAVFPIVAPELWNAARGLRRTSVSDRHGLSFLTPRARAAVEEAAGTAVDRYRRGREGPLVAREIGLGLDRVAALASSDHPSFGVEGVSVTAPYQDPRVVRAAVAAAHADLVVAHPRVVLRHAVESRTGQPFRGNVVHISGWLAHVLRSASRSSAGRRALDPVALSDVGLVDRDRFGALLDRFADGSTSSEPALVRAIWHVACVEAWAKTWL